MMDGWMDGCMGAFPFHITGEHNMGQYTLLVTPTKIRDQTLVWTMGNRFASGTGGR
uniref:Uncharacterized protein n=1 Tax=Arundo donax TaxID=35708 RepID=A0A0A9FUS1_ARUDO